MFKTSWKQLKEEEPTIYVRFKDVKFLLESMSAAAGSGHIFEKTLTRLEELEIFSDKPIGVHKTPSYGSD